MNKKKLAWQLPFLAILIIGTIIILKKQAPFRTDEGFVFGTVYKITYQSEDNLTVFSYMYSISQRKYPMKPMEPLISPSHLW